MKKVNFITAGISALTLAGMLLPVGQVLAADKTKTSVAEINLTPGDLTLDTVPDLNFGQIPIASILSGPATKTLENNKVPQGPVKTPVPDDPNQKGELSVTDTRGTNAGWQLTAQLGELKETTGKKLSGTMTLQGANMTTDNSSIDVTLNPTVAKTLTIEGPAVDIWRAAAADGTSTGQGQGVNKVEVKDNKTSLTLDQNSSATAGQYQAAITWTLSDAPK